MGKCPHQISISPAKATKSSFSGRSPARARVSGNNQGSSGTEGERSVAAGREAHGAIRPVSMNVLISIGCNSHTHLKALRGAEKDAKDVYSALVGQNPHYVAETSQLLLSPTETDIISALDKAFPQGEEVGVLTVFFSGHGGVKAGSFFLCTRNSDPDRLSTTAFPITSLFTLINEFHPNQVNIIVDACQAGGSSFDLNQLLKPEVIGSSEASV